MCRSWCRKIACIQSDLPHPALLPQILTFPSAPPLAHTPNPLEPFPSSLHTTTLTTFPASPPSTLPTTSPLTTSHTLILPSASLPATTTLSSPPPPALPPNLSFTS